MPKISLLLLTKNENDNLKKWSLWLPKLTCVDEIIVVDDNSTDNTKKILKSFSSPTLKIHIFNRNLANNFSSQRNWGLKKCHHQWVLFLDADENLPENTINFLNNLQPESGHTYSFSRQITYLGHQLSHGQCLNDTPVKLFQKNHGTFVNHVHEIWQTKDKNIYTHQIIIHSSIQNLSQFLRKINHYSTIRSHELFQQGQRTNLPEIIFYPLFKFIKLYIFQLGFLDSTSGIIFALALSFHSFLNRAKLWQLQQK